MPFIVAMETEVYCEISARFPRKEVSMTYTSSYNYYSYYSSHIFISFYSFVNLQSLSLLTHISGYLVTDIALLTPFLSPL